VRVLPDLSVPGHPEVFVVGDLVSLEQEGRPVPGVAPEPAHAPHGATLGTASSLSAPSAASSNCSSAAKL